MENIQALHHTLSDRLKSYYTPTEADSLARYMLEEVTGKQYPLLILEGYKVSDFERDRLEEMTIRLLEHEPWQQIIGYTDFCDLRIHVTPDVLIPRPETEELCLRIRERCTLPPGAHILDAGTGSGAIAIALAHFFPTAEVTALDLSVAALQVASDNAHRLGLTNITFRQADLRSHTPDTPLDLIVSNPPYVLESEQSQMAPHVLEREPHAALFVPDDDPQLYYRLLLQRVVPALRPGGIIALELNHHTALETSRLYQSAGLDTELLQDFRGLSRFLFAQKTTSQPTPKPCL